MSNLINKRAVRQLALTVANDMYGGSHLPDTSTDSQGKVWSYKRTKKLSSGKKYRQVSASFLDHIESMVRVNVQDYIKKMQDKGSTVK